MKPFPTLISVDRWRLVVCSLLVSTLHAAQPAWWTSGNTAFIDPDASHTVIENYGPANLGQLKNVARKAKLYLDASLPGGAGNTLNALVAGFSTTNISGNYAPINLGQLKAVAKPFHDRLLSAGYDTKANLIAHGYPPDWNYPYPWNPNTAVSENYAPANLGQLKIAFSFDLGGMGSSVLVDSDNNGLPDWWETSVAGGNSGGALGDWNGDGIKNVTELISGDFYQINLHASQLEGLNLYTQIY
jgi:hypothetical protein